MGLPVANIPVDGFNTSSRDCHDGRFRDETEQERNRWAVEHGFNPWSVPQCQRRHAAEDRGVCTRVRKHNGMHFAGDGEKIVGAW